MPNKIERKETKTEKKQEKAHDEHAFPYREKPRRSWRAVCGSIEPDELSFYRRIISDEPSWCVGRACSISAAIPDGKLRGSSQASRGGGREGQMGSFPSFFRQGGRVGGRWERARRDCWKRGRRDLLLPTSTSHVLRPNNKRRRRIQVGPHPPL
jgi:hypothetical protein